MHTTHADTRSTLVLVSHYYIPGSKLHVWPIGLAFQPSIASLIAIGYQLYYIRLEPIGGVGQSPDRSDAANDKITFIPWSILIYGTAAYTYHFPPTWAPYSSALHPTATPLAWMVFAFSWIAQFIGHGVFEKRAPALKDNLVQGQCLDWVVDVCSCTALVTAPFFVHLEILFDGFNCKSCHIGHIAHAKTDPSSRRESRTRWGSGSEISDARRKRQNSRSRF